MRTIIAGSRGLGYAEVCQAVCLAPWVPTLVLCGCARGVDDAGEQWAKQCGVPVEYYPADWAAHGKAAGSIRNQQMADKAEALIAVWDGRSPGTLDMMRRANIAGLRVYVWNANYRGGLK